MDRAVPAAPPATNADACGNRRSRRCAVQALVNDPDPAKRLNRLALLAALRDATLQVADFEKIAG
jgi:hypothetical protein